MLEVNEYFSGKVKSIGFENEGNKVTAGVMERGEYEFDTSTREYITVTCGELEVKLPDSDDWQAFGKYKTFVVEANQKFQLKVKAFASYICLYE